MTDSEALDLIAYYRWVIVWIDDALCSIVTRGGATEGTEDIRAAVARAIKLQAAWAMKS